MKTRFAPSPTGFFHIGTARTALFNYLFARKNKGLFILRMEDTDKERSKKEFEKDIIDSLEWLGIEWDEKVYRQSERKEIYEKYLKKLLEENKAYHCFCSKEELEAKKQISFSNGLFSKYDGKCARLKKEEADKKIKAGESSVIRLRIPEEKMEIKDLIKGKITFDTGLIGDIVIAKNLKEPLYNFSVVIDDYEMDITHVIRGEDLLPNTPKQIILYRHLGVNPPKYGHLPMILGPDRSKMSKRDGALGISQYKEEGYLKEALVNFLAFLGWSPKDDREFFSLEELVKEFKPENVNKSGAIFNMEKLDYLNGYYIRKKPLEEITNDCVPYLVEKGYLTPLFKDTERVPNLTGIMGKEVTKTFLINKTGEEVDFEYLKKAVSLYKERMKKLSEITEFASYIFEKDLQYEKGMLKWKKATLEDAFSALKELVGVIEPLNTWNAESLKEAIMPFAEKRGDRGGVLWPMRVALTGKSSSAGPFEIAEVLGKKKTIERIKSAIR